MTRISKKATICFAVPHPQITLVEFDSSWNTHIHRQGTIICHMRLNTNDIVMNICLELVNGLRLVGAQFDFLINLEMVNLEIWVDSQYRLIRRKFCFLTPPPLSAKLASLVINIFSKNPILKSRQTLRSNIK